MEEERDARAKAESPVAAASLAPVDAERVYNASPSAVRFISVMPGRQTPAAVAMSSSENLTLQNSAASGKNVNITMTDIFMEQLAAAMNIFYTPVLIVLGCIGNLISIVVFYKSKLRRQSTSQYLSALAFSDTLFLCQLLPPWLKVVRVSTLFSRNGYCQIFVYLSYVCCNYSSWLVVTFTVERFVAVVYPLRRNVTCTVKRARHIISLLAVASLLINMPVLRFAVSTANDCHIDTLLMTDAARFNLVDTILSFSFPLTIIIGLNIRIMIGVISDGRTRRHLIRQADRRAQALPITDYVPSTGWHTSHQSQQRVTKMLLIVSTVYVVLNLPAYAMRIVAYAFDLDEREYNGKWAALQQICLLFFNTNFGINFGLYCMTGQNFRRELLDTFPWVRRRTPDQLASSGVTTDRPARASSVSTSCAHSYRNNHTEASSNCMGIQETGRSRAMQSAIARGHDGHSRQAAQALGHGRRRHSEQVIQRWRFDNSRQRELRERRRESFEMHQMGDEAAPALRQLPEGDI